MKPRISLISTILALGLCQSPTLFAVNLHADEPNPVAVEWDKSVPELRAYVERVDHCLQKGQYDELKPQQQQWIVDQIATLRAELAQTPDSDRIPAPLQGLAGDFQTAIIQIEEGDIVCRHEQRTGTRMVTRRCFSRQRQAEDIRTSQNQLRGMKRPQKLIGEGGLRGGPGSGGG